MAPNPLNVASNYDDVLGLIYEQRYRYYVDNPPEGGGRPRLAVVDLEKVERVDLGGLMALVSEYQRMIERDNMMVSTGEFRPFINDAHWHPDIRNLLEDFGFYRLVRAQNDLATTDDDPLMRCVPFRSCWEVDGSVVDPLIDDMSAAAGQAPRRIATYNALIEAVKNVKNHAYPVDQTEHRADPIMRLWWAGGAYFADDDELEFVVYDQGVGIAETLKKKSLWEAIRNLCPLEFDDADVIAGAIEFGRTSTGKLERGNGLWTICRVVSELAGSQVRIISGRGAVTFFSDGTVEKKLHNNPFCGTLIHWSLSLPREHPEGAQP